MKQKSRNSLVGLSFFAVLVVVYYLLGSSSLPKSEVVSDNQKTEPVLHGSVKLPEKLSFMGEPVPLQYNDVRESLDRELMVNAYFHSQTIRFLKLAPRFMAIIVPILEADTVPVDFAYLALAESGFDPRATSPAGAVGFWQFLKGTATDYGLEVNAEVDERYHIEKSTRAACRYLKESYRKFGRWPLVAASYNAGRAFVDRQLGIQKVDNYYDLLIGEETTRYVFRILALKLMMENPKEYGFDIPESEKYPLWEVKKTTVNGPVNSWADYAIAHGTNYKILKMLNPWLRDNKLVNKAGKTYEITLPAAGFRTKTN
ncbi:MAG: lytic transglycosylase domain-containing protein [Mangrovibacterium sp.]